MFVTDAFKSVLAIAGLIVLLLLAYSFLPKPSNALTDSDARALLLNDLAQQGVSGDEIQVFNFTRGDGNDGKWSADVIVTSLPHSKCPTVEKRSYSDVLSFKFRPEQLIKDCGKRSPIVLREEAIIDSAEFPAAEGADYACAFSGEELRSYSKDVVIAYCPLVDAEGLLSFAAGLPCASWFVQWNKAGGASAFVALDSFGGVVERCQ